MNFKQSLLGAAVVSLVAMTTAHAQSSSGAVAAPDTKVGGEASVPNQDKGAKPMASQVSRDSVKSQAKTARADGTIVSGEKSTRAQGAKPTTATSTTKTRAQVRAETARARKAGEIQTGQRSTKDQDKGGVKP